MSSGNDYRDVFVRRLRYYMDRSGKTQADLVQDLGLQSSTVSNWCTGKMLPRMGKIQMLADYFGINKSDLIEDKADEPDERSEPDEPTTDEIDPVKKHNFDNFVVNMRTAFYDEFTGGNSQIEDLVKIARQLDNPELLQLLDYASFLLDRMERQKNAPEGSSDSDDGKIGFRIAL